MRIVATSADLAEAIIRYGTTTTGCGCPDRRYRRRECKHISALRQAFAIVEAYRNAHG